MAKSTRPSRRNHLSLVGSPVQPEQSDSQERLDALLDDDLIEFMDTWLTQVRDFARTVEPNKFYSLRSGNGQFGSSDYPASVLSCAQQMLKFAERSFDPIKGRGVPTTVPGITHTLEPVFQDFTSQEISNFLAGFKEALTSMHVYSEMLAADLRSRTQVSISESPFLPFRKLGQKAKVEIAYQLLEDSLETFRQMREVGFDGSPELAARNSPTLFFDVLQVTRAIDYTSRDRSTNGYQKAPLGLLPVVKDIEEMLADPLRVTQTIIREAEKYVLERANKVNHPTAGVLIVPDRSPPKAKLTVVPNAPGVEPEPNSVEPGSAPIAPPALAIIKSLQRETPRGPETPGIA